MKTQSPGQFSVRGFTEESIKDLLVGQFIIMISISFLDQFLNKEKHFVIFNRSMVSYKQFSRQLDYACNVSPYKINFLQVFWKFQVRQMFFNLLSLTANPSFDFFSDDIGWLLKFFHLLR